MTSRTFRVVDSLGDVPAPAWNAIAGDSPLLSHAFLHALHATGCASAKTGWQPCYVTAWRGRELEGAVPLYLKTHSYGEYVFDWSWADAYRRYGRRYYPKLVAAVPFTPATGPRLLASDDALKRALLERSLDLAREERASSVHVLFPDPRDALVCEAGALMMRHGMQFHWTNAGYRDFADFLSTMSHDKRKKIKQERRRVGDSRVTLVRRVGNDIAPRELDFFFRCYTNTYREHFSTPYLTRAFFERIVDTMGDNVLLVLAERDGKLVASALDVFNRDALWGRYWGALDGVPGLHFEACYYQAIEFCIERGISRFEGGAQGVHKLARGLLPSTTYSAHAIADPAFADAIASFLAQEQSHVAETIDELERSSPFRDDAASLGVRVDEA